MADNNTVTKEINSTETQFLLLTMSHIEYKIGKILSDFLKKIVGGHMSFWGALIPLFYTSGDLSSGFQSQRWQPCSPVFRIFWLKLKIESALCLFWIDSIPFYHPRMRVMSVCLCVCLCVCLSVFLSVQAITFELLNIETSFLVCRYILAISRFSVSIKVIRSRSRSYEKKW